jgi:phosphoribosylformylglycinamidine cyclo-ligase
MGTGMCIVVDRQDASKALEILKNQGERARVIGEITDGDEGVIIC